MASGKRALYLLPVLCACLITKAGFAYAQISDVQDLIFEVRMGSAIVTPAALVLEHDGQYFLPLVDIAENYEFAVTDSDMARGYVQGWYISEDNVFSVNRIRREAYHKGQRIALQEHDFIDHPAGGKDDLYMRLDVFSQIWPEISFRVDLPNMQLLAESDAHFPFMERRERKARQEMLDVYKKSQAAADKTLPYLSNPYGLISKPVLDIDSSTTWRGDDGKIVGQLSANGVQDLMYMTADYGVTLQREIDGFRRPDAFRFTLSREAMPDEPLPLGVERVELGDTRINYRDVISNGTGGRGFFFTTNKNEAHREFDAVTVEGNGPPGWEVELYRNNELINFGFVDERGEYRFEDIKTQYGNNRMRVVMYGPQGQVREENRDYNFAQSMLRPGEHSVTGGIIDADRALIPLDKDKTRTMPKGIAQSLSGAYGINNHLTGFVTYNALPTTQGDRDYVSGGATFSTGGGYGQVEAFKEKAGGHAFDLRYLTELLGVRLNFASTFFNDFESPRAGFGASAKKQETEVTAMRSFRLPFGALGLQFSADSIRRVNDDTELRLGSRQTLSRGGFQLTHQTETQLRNGDHDQSNGIIGAHMRINKWRLRGGLHYSYFPDKDVTATDAELRYQYNQDLTTAINIKHDFVSDEISSGFQVGYDFKKFLGSVDTNWREEKGWEVVLRASTSLGPYGAGGAYNMVSESQRRLSPVQAHTFLDRNLNNIFDDGDEPLAHARISVNNQLSRTQSDGEGYVVARQGDQPGLARVTLAENSLEDPYHAPAQTGYTMALRPGSMPVVAFPVIETGAIDGTLYGVQESDPVQGIPLQLVNETGDVVMTTKVAYDGFYSFEFVRPGQYTVRPDPALDMIIASAPVAVSADALFASGIDLYVQEQGLVRNAALYPTTP